MAQIRVEDAGKWAAADAGGTEPRKWIERLARLGFIAKGIVYMVVGMLALRAAMGRGGATTDSRGALRRIGDGAFGDVALVIIGVGLLGYALWQVISAVKDTDVRGSDAKGIAVRIGQAGRALAYGALGVVALGLIDGSAGRDREAAADWTARGLQAPFGKWLVIAVGASIAGYAIYQWYRAARKDVNKRLDLSGANPTIEVWVERLARFGIAARGVVFAIIGVLIIRAGVEFDPSEAGGVRESLLTLGSQPYGAAILGIIAAGLIAYGLFQLANARYRWVRA
ncbi:MAG TPA: DUF1206 domain-containing protein [Gemmatimonadaceae bacterium]|nr:DUF1206 domain-containing protein [Gemmatimonadaceae bacterium]